jgi:hypothetical protein
MLLVPDLRLASATGNRSVPVGHRSALSVARSRFLVWPGLPETSRCDGNRRGCQRGAITLAECICRTRHRFASPRVPRPHCDLQRAPFASRPLLVCGLLPPQPDASFTRQGLSGPATGHAVREGKNSRHSTSQWPASPLRTSRRLISTILRSPRLRGRRSTRPKIVEWGLPRSRLWDRRLPFGLDRSLGSLLTTIQCQIMQLFKFPLR